MKLLLTINSEHASQSNVNDYPIREAVRAVVLDKESRIALLYVSKNKYYKLPGGGIESSESHLEALKRECREEIGCDVEVMGELGMIVEYRKFCKLKQISYCYFAKTVGLKKKPQFTAEELEDGFENRWLTYKEALFVLKNNKAIGVEGGLYIAPRDLTILQSAEEFLRELKV